MNKILPSVKQMVQDYEDNIILPTLAFKDDYKQLPRTKIGKVEVKDEDEDDLRLGDIIVKKNKFIYDTYHFFKIKKQTPNKVILDRLDVYSEVDFILTYPDVTNNVIDSYQIEKTKLFSDYEKYDQNKTYQVVHYVD